MSFFVFLGAFILSFLVYKFLRRFERKYFEYHLDDEDDACENFSGSAIAISAEPSVLWDHPDPFVNSPDSSAAKYPPYKNNPKPAYSVKTPFTIRNSYEYDYTDQEYILRRKEKLYLSALNRNRPRKFRKLKKLPTVGNMPTIFESLPYPLHLKAFMSEIEEETTPLSSIKIENLPESFIEAESSPTISREVECSVNSSLNKEPAFISTIESVSDVIPPSNEESASMSIKSDVISPLYEEPDPTPAVEIKSDALSDVIETLALTSTIIESDQVLSSPAKEESVQITESLNENSPVSSPSSVNKNKRFRSIRKFFSRLCCIRRVKDS